MYLDCSFNLNSLFNSHGLSIMVDGLKVYKPMQYEGFAFLGIVVILILFFVLFSIWFRGIPKKVELFDTIDKWLLFGVTLLVLHSISHEVSFGDVLLFKIKFNDVIKDKFEIFRSIGRFFWPAYYLIVIYIMKAFYHVFTKNQVVLVMFMLLTFIAQMFDQRAIFGMYQDPKFMESAIRSDPSHWDEVLKDKKVMFLYPGYQKEYAFGGDYVNLLYVAHRHHMAINTGYLARTNKEMVKIMGDSLLYNICMGKISKNAVYITTEANQRWFLPGVESNLLKRFKIDNYIVFVPTGKSKPKNDSVHYDPSFFFSNFISNVDAKERIFVNKGVESLIQYGPFVPLYAGKYKISYILQAEINNVHSKICGVEITSKSGSSLIASKDFFSSDFKTNLPQNFDITIQLDSLTEACEFKVISSGSVALTSLGVNLIRLND